MAFDDRFELNLLCLLQEARREDPLKLDKEVQAEVRQKIHVLCKDCLPKELLDTIASFQPAKLISCSSSTRFWNQLWKKTSHGLTHARSKRSSTILTSLPVIRLLRCTNISMTKMKSTYGKRNGWAAFWTLVWQITVPMGFLMIKCSGRNRRIWTVYRAVLDRCGRTFLSLVITTL